MKTFLGLFVGIAAAGLVLSLTVHVGALAGLPNPFGKAAWSLHLGIFIVWIPAVIVSQRMAKGAARQDMWRMALRGCPKWMKYSTYALFGYAVLSFVLFFVSTVGKKADEVEALRGFSGHWMAFYCAAMAMLYSFINTPAGEVRCVNGHTCSPLANYCEVYGQPVQKV